MVATRIDRHHGSVYCIGRNHPELPIVKQRIPEASALDECEKPWPTLSSKALSSLGTDTSDIPITLSNRQVDWEAELVVEIGGDCFELDDFDHARKMMSRWGVGNDVTDRWWQNRGGGQWIRGKSFPGFAPFVFGPSACEAALENRLNRQVLCYVNGQLMQNGYLSELICPPAELIWQISQSICLLKNDLIFCGTFPGSALNRSPSIYLQPGDQVITEIEGLGCLVNNVIDASLG